MSSINFRLYADQIYGLAASKLKDIITPEISKEEFTTNFKEGKIEYSNIKNINKLNPSPQISINNLQIQNILLCIPNETENFSMNISGLKTELELFDIKENELEKLLINKRKDLINKFIEYAVKKVENKESSKSFIEGLIENLINRALNGLKINLSDIELKIKYKNNLFIFAIEKIEYSEENGMQIKNINISYQNLDKDKKEDYIIKQFSIELNIENKKELEEEYYCININMSNFEYKLTKNILLAFNEMMNLVQDTKYKYIYHRKNKLIQYYKPIKPQFNEQIDITEKNKYYHSLWLYAIKTVIKLQKYVGYEKLYLLDLNDFIQKKISKNFVDNYNKNDNMEKIILPTEVNLLKMTKNKTEQKVLDGKKGNVLANAFSFFFVVSKTDENKELTNEEKSRLDNIYTENEINKYLAGKTEDEKSSNNPIKEKIKKFIENMKINFNFSKFELILANDDINICKLFIEGIQCEVTKKSEKTNITIKIKDIGANIGERLFSERKQITDNNDLIMINISENKKIKIDLGFNCIEFNESMLNFFIIFFSSIKCKTKTKIFKEINYNVIQDKIEEKKEVDNKDKENKEDNEIFNNFSISNIPSFVLNINNENKIEFTVVNYIINKTLIAITYNIKDSFGTILDNYTFNFKRDESINKYSFILDVPLRIKIMSESSKAIFISFLKLKERIKQIQKRNLNSSEKIKNNNDEVEELYNLNYIIHKNLDIKNFDITKIKIEVLFEKVIIEIYENKVKSKFTINNLNLTYENKKLELKLEKFSIKTNLMSTMIIYLLDFESPNFHFYQHYIEEIQNEYKENNSNQELIEKEKDKKKDIPNIKYEFNINNILNSIKIYINLLSIRFQSEDNIISYCIRKIGIKKEEEHILVKIDSIALLFKKEGGKIFKIFNIDQETSVSIDQKINLVIVNLSQPKLNINLEALNNIRRSYQFLLEQLDFEIVVCKADINIINSAVKLNDEFNLSISKISLKNYDEDIIDTLYCNIENFVIKNKKRENILEQKKIDIKMITHSKFKYESLIELGDFYINLSKDDINNIFLILNQTNQNKNKFISKKTKHYLQKEKKEISNEITFILGCKLSLFDFALIDDDKNKTKNFELLFSDLDISSKIFKPKEKEKKLLKNIKINLKRINIILSQINGEEYNILEYKENMNINLDKKKLVNFNQNSDLKNQLELTISNENEQNIDDIIINFNKLGINLRIDIINNLILLINEYIHKNIQLEKLIANNNEINNNNIDKKEEDPKLRINLNKIEVKLDSLNDENRFICFNLNKININSTPTEDKEIKIEKFLISLMNNEEISNILLTKNETDFLIIKINDKNPIAKINTIIDEILINLSFSDLYHLKDFINENKKYYERNIINLLNKEKNKDNKNIIKEKNNKLFEIHSTLNKIDITLVDDYSNNYFPFLNLNIINTNSIISDKKEMKTSINLILSTYNYISSIWEPIIEKSQIKLFMQQKEENKSLVNSLKIEIPNILLNISDMFIASAFLSMKNFSKVLNGIELHNINNKIAEIKTTASKISFSVNSILSSSFLNEIDIFTFKKPQTNNNIINYTGVPLKFKYGNKIYDCDISSETNLLGDNKRNNKKIVQLYYGDNIINLPFSEYGYNSYKFINNDYLVWENMITKNRQINIKIYSPFIFKNKTNSSFQIKLTNSNLPNLFILIKPNSCSGIPLQYCNNNTSFSIAIINKEIKNDYDYNNMINMKDINETPNFTKQIDLKNSSIILKLQNKIEKVTTILITTEYRIINCLPCDLFIHSNNINAKIKKCSQFFVEFADPNDNIKLEIKVDSNDKYICKVNLNKLFKINQQDEENKKYLKFQNITCNFFYLSFILKDKKSYKGLILYSDYILVDDSGMDFHFMKKISFNIAKNIYIISNNINIKEEKITFRSEIFETIKNINLDDLLKASPYHKIHLNNGYKKIALPLTKKISTVPIKNHPNFKPNIFSMIFYILPSCKITNLYMDKKIIIKNFENEKQSMIIPPLNQVSFNFFNRDKSDLYIDLSLIGINETKCDKINILNTFNTGIYTFYSTNEFYNLEIKDSSSEGILSIFITEANLDTAKILVINKTTINFDIYQKKYEKYKQKIKENDNQILIIHDQVLTEFIAEINGKKYEIKFIPFKKIFETIEVDFDYLLVKESNGVKMKIQLYNKNEYYKTNKYDQILNLNLMITNCYISLIGDNYNKNKNLRDYVRNEVVLFNIKNMNTKVNIKQDNSIIHKNNISLSVDLKKFEIYNQISKKGKFACVFKNLEEPFLCFNQDLDLYSTDKIAKINNFNLILGKQKLYLEPEFLVIILDFIENITYRLDKINFNVDKIFLRTDKNIRDIILKNNFRKYKFTQKLICYGSKFNFPEINIDFEISDSKFEKLLQYKFGVPYFLIWILTGLSNYNQNIHLEKAVIKNYFGDFSRLFQKAQQNYATKAINIALTLGLKGIWGQIKNLFIDVKSDPNSVDVIKNRIRYPRAFYGKYHSFKNYNEQDAKVIDIVKNLYKNDLKNVYCDYLMWNKKYIFYFSGEALLTFTHNFELHYKVEYNTVNKIYNDREILIVKYIQKDGENYPPSAINCETEEMAENIVEYFQNYLNKTNIY